MALGSFIDHWVTNPRWRTLHRLGQARILGISAATLIAAPLLSRLILTLRNWLQGLGDPGAQHLADELHLPLVLILLLGTAFFALIGKAIYETACPPYIKCGSDYSYYRHSYSDAFDRLADDFAALWNNSEEKDRHRIKEIIAGALHYQFLSDPSSIQEDAQVITRDTVVKFQSIYSGSKHGPPVLEAPLVSLLRTTEPNIGEEIFVVLRRMQDDCRYPLRILCAMFYYASISLAIGVTIYQMHWVYLAM